MGETRGGKRKARSGEDDAAAAAKPAAGRRKRRSTNEVRALILEAALASFAESGMAGATTRQIADRAGVAEPLIFNNFVSKAALFNEAVITPFNNMTGELHQRVDQEPPDRERRSFHFVQAMYAYLSTHAELLQALVKSPADGSDGVAHGLDELFEKATRRMRIRYERSTPKFSVAPDRVVRYAFGMVAGAVLLDKWLFPDAKPAMEERVADLAHLLYRVVEPDRD